MANLQLVGKPGLLRDLNYRAVLELLAHKGPKSRVELAEQLDLSRPSMSRLVENLVQVGLVSEGKRVSSKIGRRQTLLAINPKAAVVAGFSIRPKRIRLHLADLQGKTLYSSQESTATSTTALSAQMLSMVETARTESKTTTKRLSAITIGVTGAWDAQKSELHASPNLPFLEGQNLLKLANQSFSQALDLGSIEVDNEVNYAALGEQVHGTAQNHDSFFYLNLGSGIGGAAVVNRQLHRGEHGFAGELGYLPIWNGERYQSLEELTSRNALARLASLHNLGSDAMDLLEAARQGNLLALDLTRQTAQYLAIGLCSIITTLNPNLIVVGGSIGRYSDILIPLISTSLPESLLPHCQLLGTTLKGDAALLGAVAKALELARSNLITTDLL